MQPPSKIRQLVGFVLCFQVFVTGAALSEGSRELVAFESSRGGDARYALWNTDFVFTGLPLWTVFDVYLQAGETLNLGSNTMHSGVGNIYVWAPGTVVFTDTFPSGLFASALVDCVGQAAGDTNLGLIETRAKELAGPEQSPGDGGYVPCQYTAAVSGLYPVMFRAAQDTSGSNPGTLSISDPNIPVVTTGVHAWDATVLDGMGVERPGRLMTRYLSFYETVTDGPDQELFVHTRDGHRFRLQFDEIDGLGFLIFANNKGIQGRDTGLPTYRTWPLSAIDDMGDDHFIHPVTEPDTADDVNHRLFVNPPDSTAIIGAGGLGAVEAYLASPEPGPLPTNFRFDGTASGGGLGQAPNGFGAAAFLFDSDPVRDGTRFVLDIDTDGNGSFEDAVDRRLGGTFDSSGNSVAFDGLDGLGIQLAFDSSFTARLRGSGGEVHFPLADVESFPGGMVIERLSATDAGDVFFAAYDDFNGAALTDASPTSLPEGADSSTGTFRAWSAGTGNNDMVDTWTFVASPPVSAPFVVGAPNGAIDIPTLSEWSRLVFALLLTVFAWERLRPVQ